jgi:thiol-disulfide isomerase/thioredoxin
MRIQIAFAGVALVAMWCGQLWAADDSSGGVVDVDRDGAFGFPQREAKVLCDKPELRFSIWNDAEHLFAQAVLWMDDDASLGKTEDNREIGDGSTLILDLDGDGEATANVDRNYALNPWPNMPGLHYQTVLSRGSTTGLEKDSKGRGAVRYVKVADGKQVRVDSFLIPMSEISRKAGDKIRVCYYGRSMKPALIVNSGGYEREGKYYSHHIPRSMHHDYKLVGSEIDALQVPEGRNDISLSKRKTVPMPKVGEAAPEITAGDWINLKNPASLKDLRGKVVVVEFWATWCGPCIDAIPHLTELSQKYGGKDFQLLSLVAEGHQTMDRFLSKRTVKYPIGLESTSLDDYGITGIPHAFVIDRDGKVLWHGHSASPEMETMIGAALKRSK